MATISKFQFCGFRGFGDLQTFNPAVPNGTPGSGLKILVGPNNGGKSTILEAIEIVARGTPFKLIGTRET